MRLDVKVSNPREVDRALAALKLSVRNKLMRQAMGVANRDVAKAAKAQARNVSTRTRQLWRSIGQKIKTYRNSAITVGLVGPRRGFAKAVRFASAKRLRKQEKTRGGLAVFGPRVIWVNPTRYAHLLEKKAKQMRRAKPFLAPAWAAAGSQAQATIASELRKRIAAEAAKVRAKK